MGLQLPNPTGAKLSKIETLKLANAYLNSLKMMLNEKEDTKFQPMVTGHKKNQNGADGAQKDKAGKRQKYRNGDFGIPRAGRSRRIWK
ncbi:Protein CBG07500 [Caenorhabditis briggsae]|uniref:Protein CBG07500 n=1 Tax=Caenorhabditis briggsae TaxID=6238 RepID=A8X4N4_CAEBR|nr:Protein CBG07500 [Caenorhabditis briggsae]CAP27594.1 Protein CBG07500 [Caenorhabditis briggsae]